MDLMGKLLIDTHCDNCGFVKGVAANNSSLRCTSCGRYSTDDPDVCCARHEVRRSPYSTGECPICEQERHRQDMIQHEMTRDPQVEPW